MNQVPEAILIIDLESLHLLEANMALETCSATRKRNSPG